MKILVTGSSGLIGGECVEYFTSRGHEVVGLDNNMRKEFFGPAGDTLWNMNRIYHKVKNFTHMPVDIRDEGQLYDVFCPDPRKAYTGPFDAVIHCAAQPSHDKAREIPLIDHSVNVNGTLMMLEMTRLYSPNAVFIFTSTNKVYGDAPNEYPVTELETRYDYNISKPPATTFFSYHGLSWNGINEDCRIDQSTHSIFGANKAGADLLVQEYAKTYGMKTFVFRGGCLTGPGHSGVELHGFLSYLVKCCVSGRPYTVYGYKGKQVRDNIHSNDVVRAFEEVIQNPRFPGSVYNLGGGRENSISMLEAISKIEQASSKKLDWKYVDENRLGDHICYISDMSKFKKDYPNWKITKSIDDTIGEMVRAAFWDFHTEDDEILKYDLTPDSLVVDVGGYRGTWSADIIARYDPNVFVFEPTSEFYHECYTRFAGNKKVSVINTGLADETGLVTIKKQGMNTSAYREEFPEDRVFGEPVDEVVNFIDVSFWMNRDVFDRDIDLFTCNCEGGEYKILPRLIETGQIKQIKNLQVQFHDFIPGAEQMRAKIRERLRLTHKERFCYPWRWESWERL